VKKRRLLILANVTDRAGLQRDFEAIAERVAKLAPEIHVAAVGRRRSSQWKLLPRVFRPALTVAFGRVRQRRFLAGEILDCLPLPKHVELARLRAAGVAVPDWVVVAPGVALDPAEWGPYVVVKPTVSMRGVEVRIRRTARVRYHWPNGRIASHSRTIRIWASICCGMRKPAKSA
jgi:hypothetical protein